MISPCINAPIGGDESRKAESLKRGRHADVYLELANAPEPAA